MSISPREFAIQVTKKLQAADFEAFWAGGCVRDQLIGMEPKDYDIATSAEPDQIRDLFGRRRTLSIGAAFGVITVLGPKSAGNIEVATFRSDDSYSDGRHPDSVTFSTAEMDAQRRDFTVNGLFYDPIQDQVIDYVGGQADIEAQVIRAIGDPHERIAEDKLRMIRAVRIAATYRFHLDRETREVIRRRADEIHVVSAERIAAELKRILVHETRRSAVELLDDTKLLEYILPETKKINNWSKSKSLAVLDEMLNPDFATALAGLLFEIVDSKQAEKICRRLRLSNQTMVKTRWILANYQRIQSADQLPWSELQPLLIADPIESALEFARAHLIAHGKDLSSIDFCRERLDKSNFVLNPPRLMGGDDLKTMGFMPGPDFSQVLSEIRRAQLDGEVENREQAKQLARQLLSQRRA